MNATNEPIYDIRVVNIPGKQDSLQRLREMLRIFDNAHDNIMNPYDVLMQNNATHAFIKLGAPVLATQICMLLNKQPFRMAHQTLAFDLVYNRVSSRDYTTYVWHKARVTPDDTHLDRAFVLMERLDHASSETIGSFEPDHNDRPVVPVLQPSRASSPTDDSNTLPIEASVPHTDLCADTGRDSLIELNAP